MTVLINFSEQRLLSNQDPQEPSCPLQSPLQSPLLSLFFVVRLQS